MPSGVREKKPRERGSAVGSWSREPASNRLISQSVSQSVSHQLSSARQPSIRQLPRRRGLAGSGQASFVRRNPRGGNNSTRPPGWRRNGRARRGVRCRERVSRQRVVRQKGAPPRESREWMEGMERKKRRPREKSQVSAKGHTVHAREGAIGRQDRISPVLAGFSGPFSGARSD